MKFLPIAWVILLASSNLFAQVLTLEEAVQSTFDHYPTLATQRSALAALRANAQVVRDNRLPNLRLHDQVSIGTANGMSGSYFSMGLIVPTSGGRRAVNQADLATGNIALASFDWEIYNFGRFTAEGQRAKADIAVGEANLEREQFGLRQAVINTYLDLLWLGQNLTIERRNMARVDTARRAIGNLVRNGVKPGLDTSLANVEFSRAKLAYWQVLERYQQATVQLATLTGKPAGEVRIDTTFRVNSLLAPMHRTEPILAHPLLRYRDRLITQQRAEIDLIRKSALPRISLMTSAWARGSSLTLENEYGPLGSGLLYSRSNFLVGIGATFNITDLRRASHRVNLQQQRVQEATHQLAVEKIQLQNTQTTADSVLAVLRLELNEIPTAIQSANTAYKQRLALYNNGVENILALTDALKLLTSVEKDYVETINKAIRVRLQKAYGTGDFDDFFTLFRP